MAVTKGPGQLLFRLILFLFAAAAIGLTLASVMVTIRSAHILARDATGDLMPKTMRSIAYTALLILMFGVATGWLGAA